VVATSRKQQQLHLTYDAGVDALYIELSANRRSARTIEQRSGVYADYDSDGLLIGVEILDASARYPAALLRRLAKPETLLTLTDASAEAGISADTLRKQIHNDRIVAVKRGRDWLIPYHELMNYLESRAPQGRPATSQVVRRRVASG